MAYTAPIELKDTISGLNPGLFNCTFDLLAIGFNVLLLLFLNPVTDYLIWILVNIVAALVFHMLLLARKRHKFRHLLSNYELESLMSRAKDRLEISRRVELWSIDDNGLVLTSATNLLFSCIIMSKSTMNKILEKPDSGEVILADELVLIDKGPRKFEFVWNYLHYFLFSTVVFAFQETLFQLLLPVGVIFIQVVIILLALAFFTFTVRSRYIPSKPDIESIYGMTRFDAEYEVFGRIDRGLLPFMRRSSSRARMDESSEFRLGMLPVPLFISVICGVLTYFIFTIPLSIISEKMPFVVLPLSILFGSIGFGFSLDLLNPIKYVYPQSRNEVENPPLEDNQTRHLAKLLHATPQYRELHVQKRTAISGSVVTEIVHPSEVRFYYAILSETVTQNLEPDELLIYAIAEMRRNSSRQRIEKGFGRLSGIVIFSIFLCGIVAFVIYHPPLEEFVLLLLFLCIGLLFVPLALMINRTNEQNLQVDREIQREYPSFINILGKLQDKGFGFEAKELKERFDYLAKCNRSHHQSSSLQV